MNKKIQLILIVLAFAAPALIALLMQTPMFHWDPSNTRNRGELIRPAVQVANDPALRGLLADGEHWTLVLVPPGDCDAGCEKRLQLLHRVREAQGRRMERLHLRVWRAPVGPWEEVLDAPSNWPAELKVAPGGLVLIDPDGFAMMRYAAQADPTDVRKDLAHLLKWTESGR
jgi:hypothetical protein